MMRFTKYTQTATSLILAVVLSVFQCSAFALGTPAGTDISNTAAVSYQIGADTLTESSNQVVITVAEMIDVDVTLQSGQVAVEPGTANSAIVYTVTNTGNGFETITLSALSVLPGDDFDPVLSTPDSIYFDTDGSGDLSPADQAYVPGTNDPTLASDESITVLIVNDIPAGLVDTNIGQTQLTATATTGTGVAGTVVAGGGDGGVDAMIGATEGADDEIGEYVIRTIIVSVAKSATVVDPFGGDQPVPGAEITYQIITTVTGTGTATAVAVTDAIPANTTFLPASIVLNGTSLTDASDADAGELDAVGAPSIVVQLGDVADADGPQIVEFTVVID